MTGADFINTVLENLGVLAEGQTASAEQVAIVRRRMVPKFAQLAQEDIALVPDNDDIDDAQALLLADVVARECATPFSIAGEKLMELEAMAEQARYRLQVVTRERAYKSTLRPENWWSEGTRAWNPEEG